MKKATPFGTLAFVAAILMPSACLDSDGSHQAPSCSDEVGCEADRQCIEGQCPSGVIDPAHDGATASLPVIVKRDGWTRLDHFVSPDTMEESTEVSYGNGVAFESVGIDSAGNAAVVWRDEMDDYRSLFIRQLDSRTGLWGKPRLLEHEAGHVGMPALAMTDAGLFVAWFQEWEDGKWYPWVASFDASSGEWGEPQRQDGPFGDALNGNLTIAPFAWIDRSGRGHLAWRPEEPSFEELTTGSPRDARAATAFSLGAGSSPGKPRTFHMSSFYAASGTDGTAVLRDRWCALVMLPGSNEWTDRVCWPGGDSSSGVDVAVASDGTIVVFYVSTAPREGEAEEWAALVVRYLTREESQWVVGEPVVVTYAERDPAQVVSVTAAAGSGFHVVWRQNDNYYLSKVVGDQAGPPIDFRDVPGAEPLVDEEHRFNPNHHPQGWNSHSPGTFEYAGGLSFWWQQMYFELDPELPEFKNIDRVPWSSTVSQAAVGGSGVVIATDGDGTLVVRMSSSD